MTMAMDRTRTKKKWFTFTTQVLEGRSEENKRKGSLKQNLLNNQLNGKTYEIAKDR